MSDIVQRLRGWFKDVNAVPAIDLMDEAAAEIERLRTLATHATPREGSVQSRCTLTDEEREAVEVAAAAYASDHGERFAAILRRLLKRLHT